MYLWIKNTNNNYNNVFLENVFNNTIFINWWSKNYLFFIKLYKTTFLLNLLKNKNSINHLNLIFNINNNFDIIFKTYFKLTYLNLFFFNNYFYNLINFTNSMYFYKNKYKWNLIYTNLEFNNYNYLIKSKSFFFFFNNWTFNNFNFLINKNNEFFFYLKIALIRTLTLKSIDDCIDIQ